MKASHQISVSRRSSFTVKIACAIMSCWLLISQGTLTTFGDGQCFQTTSHPAKTSNCNCTSTGPVVTGCGVGFDIERYAVCHGSFEKGYENCLNRKQQVGTKWNCTWTVTWRTIAACSARGLACTAACTSSATHAGILCAACIADYLANCTGCAFYTCVKTNVKPVYEKRITTSSGTCPKVVNTIR